MGEKRVKFYGSAEDLHSFGKHLKESGFVRCEEYPKLSSGFPEVESLSYNIVPGIGNCIKTLLSAGHLRLFGQNILITGDLPAEKIETLLDCADHFDIAKT